MTGVLAAIAAVCAVGPAAVFCVNLGLYRKPERLGAGDVSVLIPARNEEAGIEAAVRSVLASCGVEVEVVVMDDGSSDGTAEIVAALARGDARVRLEQAPRLAEGWNGKQAACWALAQAARYDVMCFVDADVRLGAEVLTRMVGLLEGKGLVSGFPREETGSWMEWMVLPLIHFVLLGFLPVWMMRKGTEPAYAAGCGQFLMVRREAYFACGGHSAIRGTMHDGLLLPRVFRRAGFRTDLADLTELATCRMYRSAGQVWFGLAKNATEGLADARRIVPATALLLVGQVIPFFLLVWLDRVPGRIGVLILAGAVGTWLPRWLGVWRFRQDWRGALLHPAGVLLLLGVQWYALGRKIAGRAVVWKAREY